MKVALGFIIGLSAVALGCASVQETRMFKGPFGRTQIASTVLAADPASGKILVQTSDGALRVFRVNPAAGQTLGRYRVGDDLLLTFDDRVAGDAVVAIEGLTVSAANMPGGVLPRFVLPAQVRVGAPLFGGGTAFGSVTAVAGDTVVGVGTGIPLGAGVVVPGFGSIAALQPGALNAQQVASLGLGPSNGITLGAGPVTAGNFTPGTVMPGVTTLNPATGGKPSVQGPFTPGTVAPGVSRSSDGKPINQGPFTPGTVAPGVSATLGNAPPTSSAPATGSSGSSQGMTIRTPGAAPPVPESAAASSSAPPAGGISVPGMTGTGAPLTGTATSGTTATGTSTTGTGTAGTSAPTRDTGTVRPGGSLGTAPPAAQPAGMGTTTPPPGSNR